MKKDWQLACKTVGLLIFILTISSGGMRFLTVLVSLAFLAGCLPDPSISTSSNLAADNAATQFFIALGTSPSSHDGEAFKIYAAPVNSIDEKSLQFCLGEPATCGSEVATIVKGILDPIPSYQRFVSAADVRLSNQLAITVMAKDSAGQVIRQTVRLVVKGGTIAVVPVVPVVPDQPLASPCYKPTDQFTCDVELAIVRMTNEKRASVGKGPLAYDAKVAFVSRLWSIEQAARGDISHEWFSNGRWRSEYVKEFNESPRLGGENVAMNGGLSNGSAENTAKTFINQWWNSSGHRANMLGNFKTIGAGVAKRGSSWYGTQNFGN